VSGSAYALCGIRAIAQKFRRDCQGAAIRALAVGLTAWGAWWLHRGLRRRSSVEAAGFVVEVVEKHVSDPHNVDVVLDQDPAAGAKALQGTTVTITVGTADEQSPSPSPEPSPSPSPSP